MTQTKIERAYEELRYIIDGGSESFTHKDAVQYLKDSLAPLKWTPEDTAYRPGGLAQPEQEPVAWQISYKSATGEQRSAVHGHNAIGDYRVIDPDAISTPLYTSPPQRQPLTDEQIYEMYNEPRSDAEMVAFARAIEAAHGIGDKT